MPLNWLQPSLRLSIRAEPNRARVQVGGRFVAILADLNGSISPLFCVNERQGLNQVDKALFVDGGLPESEQVLKTGCMRTPKWQSLASAALGIDEPTTQHRRQIGVERRTACPDRAARRLVPSPRTPLTSHRQQVRPYGFYCRSLPVDGRLAPCRNSGDGAREGIFRPANAVREP